VIYPGQYPRTAWVGRHTSCRIRRVTSSYTCASDIGKRDKERRNDSVVELRKLDPYFPSILLIDKTPLPLGATLFEFIIRSIRPAREDGICVGVDVKAVREERLVV